MSLGPVSPDVVVVRSLSESFEAFFVSEYGRLVRGLFLVTGDADEAEELAQETMARVCERWGRVKRMDSPPGYLWRTAFNLNSKRRRRLGVRRRARIDAAPSPRDPSGVVAATVDVRAALASLSVDHREVLVLIDWLQHDVSYVARLLEIEPVSVRSRLHRARHNMRAFLEDDDD